MRTDLEPLVLAAADGDAEAYGKLVSETSSLVSSITLAIVRDFDLSRDVAQEVFLSAWRDLKNLRNPASFLPWLRQTARNRAKTALRSGSRRQKIGAAGALDELLPALMDPQPSITDRMIAKEELRALEEALSALPEETREVLALFYREGRSVAQVALLLELSEVAVKKRLSRARAALRETLRETIGEALSRTKPGAAFTAGVIAALPSGAPPAAAAATLTVSKISGASTWMLLLKALAPVSGILLGSIGGVGGVLIGSRKWLRDARDDEERRALLIYRRVNSVVVVFYAMALTAIAGWTRNPLWTVPWFLMFIATLAVLQHVWLPRIIKKRLEAEMREDPRWASARRRRERRLAILGWTLGILGGSLGLALGFWSSLK